MAVIIADPVPPLQLALVTAAEPLRVLFELVIWKLAVVVHPVAVAVKVVVKYPAASPVKV